MTKVGIINFGGGEVVGSPTPKLLEEGGSDNIIVQSTLASPYLSLICTHTWVAHSVGLLQWVELPC